MQPTKQPEAAYPSTAENDLADLTLKAWNYAAEVHRTQSMPGSDLPYLKHLGTVAMEVLSAHAREPMDNPALAVQCAILHDTMEDQDVSHADLLARFGPAVADGVQALSKNPALPKADAMSDSLARIRQQPRAVWCVKLADRIANLQAPPKHWDAPRIDTYRTEATRILDALGTAHRGLAERLSRRIAAYPPKTQG